MLHRHIFRAMENALDRPGRIQHLRQPEVAKMCMEAIRTYAEQGRWSIIEYVIMPNHFHIFFELEDGGLDDQMLRFKRYTGGRVKKLLGLDRKVFWQREWFDHWSRSPAEDLRIAEYIRNNPVKAGLVKDFRDWPYGSWNDLELGNLSDAYTPIRED